MSYAKLIVIGNTVRAPEVRYTPKGTAVCELDVAVNRKWKTESGEEKSEVCFLSFTVWGRRAEVAGQYLDKGSPVFLEAHPKTDEWTDKDTGQKRTKLKFVVENLQLLGGKKDSSSADEGLQPGPTERQEVQQAPPARKAGGGAPAAKAEAPVDDSNIPF